jgi:hypothetical protein
MPTVFGESVNTVEEIVRAFGAHGDRVRGVYRARYVFDEHSTNPYAGTTLERPESLSGNPAGVVYPWEQIFLAAAACAGSDYSMLAAYYRIPLERVELIVEGLFDPRHEFDGLAGFTAPSGSEHCFLTLQLRATLLSSAPRDILEQVHARVLANNMVLGALRGIPVSSELRIEAPHHVGQAPVQRDSWPAAASGS